MANDPVLQRSMFQKQGPSVTPAVGLGTGIGSVTTPDQNAQALRNMFQPTVSIGAPTEMLQQPVQSFQEGGLARLLPSFLRPTPPTEDELARVAQRAAMRRMAIDEQYMDESRQPQREPLVAQYTFREPRNFRMPPSYSERVASANAASEAETPRQPLRLFDVRDIPGPPAPEVAPSTMEGFLPPDTQMAESGIPVAAPPTGMSRSDVPPVSRAVPSPPPPVDEVVFQTRKEAPPAAVSAAPERQKGSLELTLDGIRAERAAERRENALLALMQAGFAIAGGRSPNAISNIGAGGQAGIGAFAAMERASREDAAARRREAIQLATTERQLALSERQLEKEPETIRTFRVLGGGDIMKGFEIFNADKKLQAAVAITKDITASEEDRRAANEYIRGQLTKARTGGGSFAGFSATPVR